MFTKVTLSLKSKNTAIVPENPPLGRAVPPATPLISISTATSFLKVVGEDGGPSTPPSRKSL